ncbi:MAG TPA: non-homologous end-joining DNA ligase, partial [Blastocatellia bacterium]|nr:non-homologous end-joining DNA ligase [Blastocatellia bacterium]
MAAKSVRVREIINNAFRALMPEAIEPMLATLVDEPFDDPEWYFETKWDGVRVICYLHNGKFTLVTRNGKEVAFRYPELADLSKSVNAKEAILDGEIVTFDKEGRSAFQALQSRIGLKEKFDIEREAEEHPAVYCVFDLLYLDGYDLRNSPLAERKQLLKSILKESKHLRISEHIKANGIAFFHEAEARHLEGIIAKQSDSTYQAGRSSSWLKIKTQFRQEVVICGFTAPRRTRKHFGALVVGLYDKGELRYVGHVGGGFNLESLKQVYDLMQPLKTKHSPFTETPSTNEPVEWVKPKLVCEVKFAEWTAGGIMRQPIFEGLRDDKRPEQCRFEMRRHTQIEVVKAERKAAQSRVTSKSNQDLKEGKDVALETYWKKRDFRKTKEPKGRVERQHEKAKFVIHEHHASILHFDLRLEIGGVLKSWSVPKGPTLDPSIKRLAVEVEDHPLAYASFNGTIPEGQYGAGRSLIYDEGTVTFHEQDPLKAWEAGRLGFTLSGKKLKGDFALVRMRRGKGKPQWLLMKKADAQAQEGWQLELVEPDERFSPEPSSKGRKQVSSRNGSAKTSATDKSVKRKVTSEKPDKLMSVNAFLKLEKLEGDIWLNVGRTPVEVTHLEKLYWPKEKISKGELIRYYLEVGKVIMPYLKDRPCVLKRYPNGLADDGFFQHDVKSAPALLKTELLTNEVGRKLNYAVYTDLASLIYLVNLGTIGQHPWLSRVGS